MFTKNTAPANHSVIVSIAPYFALFVKILGLPNLAIQPPCVRQQRASKVDGMKRSQQLSREAIEEFKAIYQEEFGEVLSDDEVQEIATRLLRFFGILRKDQ